MVGKLLLTKEVAELLRVGEEHVRELIRQRKLKAFKLGKSYRISEDNIKLYIKEHSEDPKEKIA